MLVLNVLIFISDLREIKSLIPSDVVFYIRFLNRFAHRDPFEALNDYDVQFLINCFKSRGKKIAVGFENSYTLNTGTANQKWIQLAKELASFTGKNYVEILFPGVTNTVDFNNLSLLAETERPENFYLGENKKILYRKRGLCELLIKNGFILSTRRNVNSSKLSAMSVDELTQLQACKQVNGNFSIAGVSFTNFWDFLQKKVFTRLQSKGEMPVDLLPHFLALIERYYVLKTTGADFKLFHQSAQRFFALLYEYQLDDINFFYGIEIPFKGKKYYLLDFLVVINKVESYVLEEHLKALAEWLFKFHPALKVNHKELKPIYNRIQQVHSYERQQEQRLNRRSLNQCLKMLLSLFTLEFECLPLTGHTISFWDRTHSVFFEGRKIFSLFESLLVANDIDALVLLYQRVITEYIIPGKTDVGCYTWFTRSNSVRDWYRRVDQDDLHKSGVYWFQPELLMHVLLKVRESQPYLAAQINKFLDELIHTYSQDHFDLMKQLRVNILFSDFINKLPNQQGQYLITLMQLYDKYDAKPKFLSNCIRYVVSRLSNISTVDAGGSVQFFSGIRKMDSSKLDLSHIECKHLNGVIDTIKARLYCPALNLDDELLEKMMVYLRSLTRPILTIAELQEVRNSARTIDYLGAPT